SAKRRINSVESFAGGHVQFGARSSRACRRAVKAVSPRRRPAVYLFRMLLRTCRTPPDFIEPCLPTALHEIKHDGFRLMSRLDAVGVRLLTRNGHDWSPRYPLIVPLVPDRRRGDLGR